MLVKVLILIFLENALRQNKVMSKKNLVSSLNPYFFGKCSTANSETNLTDLLNCLNPYFFGKCSTAVRKNSQRQKDFRVLILIFLENALRPIFLAAMPNISNLVLILIFLENALRRWELNKFVKSNFGLNPYFFGKCSTAAEGRCKSKSSRKS